jgi:hypothetical protein
VLKINKRIWGTNDLFHMLATELWWISSPLSMFVCIITTRQVVIGVSYHPQALCYFIPCGILFIDYLEKGKTITGEYYSNLLTRLDKKNSWEKTQFAKEKNHLSSRQCTRPQECFGNGKIKEYALWIVGTSTLFLRFGSLSLISLPKTQNLSRWSAFFFESRGDCSCKGVFCRSYKEPLQGRDNGAGASLE